MNTISTDTAIDVPREVATCPYCGGDLFCRPDWWEEGKDGWFAMGTGLECKGEPELDEGTEDEWDEWFRWHSYMPYVYWLPVDTTVLKWLKANYRFEVHP